MFLWMNRVGPYQNPSEVYKFVEKRVKEKREKEKREKEKMRKKKMKKNGICEPQTK